MQIRSEEIRKGDRSIMDIEQPESARNLLTTPPWSLYVNDIT